MHLECIWILFDAYGHRVTPMGLIPTFREHRVRRPEDNIEVVLRFNEFYRMDGPDPYSTIDI